MNNKQSIYSETLLNRHNIKIISNLLLLAMSYHLIFSPTIVLALEENKALADDSVEIQTELVDNEQEQADEQPKEELVIIPLGIKGVSAYNVGDPYQCDNSPCTAANGENICLALELGYKRCAANFVPFGTLLEIEGYGRCMVTDRMNSRFSNHVDIAMKRTEKQEALKFGRKKLNIKIIKKIESI